MNKQLNSNKSYRCNSVKKIEKWREAIDSIDHRIIKLIHQRLKLVEKISLVKNEKKMPLFQKKRLTYMLKERAIFGKKHNLSKKVIIGLVRFLHNTSLNHQKNKLD
ncbi:MAG: chorismate mutase [Oligoflexia bacterium]|nr:chorismate mutase [Oligoflexia bacterium]